jgi:flagellar biosynthetic protein FliQ
MPTETVVHLARLTLETTLWLSVPILAIAMVVSLLVSVIQVMTSVQETTVATVPRLAAVAAAVFVLMPWIFRRLVSFTSLLFSDFRPFLG